MKHKDMRGNERICRIIVTNIIHSSEVNGIDMRICRELSEVTKWNLTRVPSGYKKASTLSYNHGYCKSSYQRLYRKLPGNTGYRYLLGYFQS